MLKYDDISVNNPYFVNCAKYAFALLRFSNLNEINEIDSECKQIIAHIVSNLSKLTADSKLFLDRLAKAYQNLYVPLLKRNYDDFQGENSDSYIRAASGLLTKISDLVKSHYIIYDEAKIDIANDFAYVVDSETIKTPTFREAQEAVNVVNRIYESSEQITQNWDRNMTELKSQERFLHDKYKNSASAKVSALKSSLDAYSSIEMVIDACYIAKLMRSEYVLVDSDTIVSFLDKNMGELIEKAVSVTKKYCKSGGKE